MSEKDKPKQIVTTAIVISFLAGGIAGGLVGAITGGIASDYIVPWFEETFLGQDTNSTEEAASSSSDESVTTVLQEEQSATIEAVAKVSPSVGSIIVSQDLSKLYDLSQPSPYDYFFGYPASQPQGEQEVASGTGFIVSSDGYILTNKHVIDVSEAEYTFILQDGTQYDAQLVDTDPFNDIAVLKIDALDLPYVDLGDSDKMQLGQTVIAIGNTLSEYPNTVTRGIISGIGRTITAGNGSGQYETIEEVFQTDAAINPGNSGGPLINSLGQVVGINTAVSQEGQLIGFAIPINQVKPDIESVKQEGKIVRPYLGIRYRIITAELAEVNDLPVENGALLVRSSDNELAVIPGSPADKAGLEENDIITEINNEEISEDNTLSSIMKSLKVGDEVTMKVYHDGKEKTVKATLEKYTE